MLTDDQQRSLAALHTQARAAREASDRAWRDLWAGVAGTYTAGQHDHPRTTDADIGRALGVTPQQAGKWRRKATE